jgi:hypothetical protein
MQGYEPGMALRLLALARNPPPPCTPEQQRQLRGLSVAFGVNGASEFQRELSCCNWPWDTQLRWRDLEDCILCDRLRSGTLFFVCGADFGRNCRAISMPLLLVLLGDWAVPGLAQLAPAFPDSRLPPVRPAAARRRCPAAPFRAVLCRHSFSLRN